MNQHYLIEWTLGEGEVVGISNDPIAIEAWRNKGFSSIVSCDEYERYENAENCNQ